MSRNLYIPAVDGHPSFTIAELILTNNDFKKEIGLVIGLTLHPHSELAKELAGLGAKIVPPQARTNTLCLIPPTHEHKYDLTTELIETAKKANALNVCFISSAGCGLAERDRQPGLREFIDLETRVVSCKGNSMTSTGHSPVVIKAGFHAENLLLYSQQAQTEGIRSAANRARP
ncbi:hypothetical protein N7539_003503 [Penicillium diatomitis]|uniref:Uncharacterized protein n=1 Tax=Penicillium diatomitis TaxID=2819901 RepID=A0A9W9XCN2_9EURO|nr:uncharacterized protein N7539_003503 [Penicillium diatomitis]KAJ5488613.1 hypothetical protein N7539_003503 [Penicillium diatomitis]